MRKQLLVILFVCIGNLYGQDWKASPMLYKLTVSRGDTISKFIVFGIADAADRFIVFTVFKMPVGKMDVPGFQETFHAVIARLSVHVCQVVFQGELRKRRPVPPAAILKIVVEGLFPGGGVKLRRVRHHPVEIENDCFEKMPWHKILSLI